MNKKVSEKLARQSEELTKHSERSALVWKEQRLISQRHLATLEAARIIKKNALKT